MNKKILFIIFVCFLVGCAVNKHNRLDIGQKNKNTKTTIAELISTIENQSTNKIEIKTVVIDGTPIDSSKWERYKIEILDISAIEILIMEGVIGSRTPGDCLLITTNNKKK